MKFSPHPTYAAIQYALAEMQHGRHWTGSWKWSSLYGFIFTSWRAR